MALSQSFGGMDVPCEGKYGRAKCLKYPFSGGYNGQVVTRRLCA